MAWLAGVGFINELRMAPQVGESVSWIDSAAHAQGLPMNWLSGRVEWRRTHGDARQGDHEIS